MVGTDTSDELVTLTLHESVASAIAHYESAVIPGLLQSRDYASALLGGGGQVASEALENAVQRHIARQQLLHRTTPPPPDITFFIGEAALRAVVGDHRVMHDQLMRLHFACAWRNCAVRVVPTSANDQIDTIYPFRLISFEHYDPVVAQDLFSAMTFMDKPAAITRFRAAVDRLNQVALPLRQSRDAIMRIADDHSRQASAAEAAPPPPVAPVRPRRRKRGAGPTP